MLGCGRSTTKTLERYGIHTIGQLAAAPESLMQARFGKNGLALKRFANGEDYSSVMKTDYVSPVKSVGHGITTMQDLENAAEVWCVMLELVQEIGARLRQHKKRACGVSIMIRSNDLFVKEWQCRLTMPTQSPAELAKTAFTLFQKNYRWVQPIRSETVRTISLVEEDCPIQLDLFTDAEKLNKRERLELTVESIRARFGKGSIRNAVLFKDIKLPAERDAELIMPTGMLGMGG